MTPEQRDLAAVSEGFCPRCRVPLGACGGCPSCMHQWQAGHAGDGTPWVEHREPGRTRVCFVR